MGRSFVCFEVRDGRDAAVGRDGADGVVKIAVLTVVLDSFDHVELWGLLGGVLFITVLVVKETSEFHIELIIV